MACGPCGGGSGASSVRKGVKATRVASRSGKLPWAHISPRGAVARYKTEDEANSAMKLFGGEVEKRAT